MAVATLSRDTRRKPKARASGVPAAPLSSAVCLSNESPWQFDANLANRLFGPPKFTPEEQAANPGAQMTRCVKDVLRVGKWKRGVDRSTGKPVALDVTPEMLQSLADNFALAKSRGVDFNIGKNHANPATDLIHPDDLIAPIDGVAVAGNTLWLCAYVSPQDKAYLSNRARKVSAGIRWGWTDGHCNEYPIQMPHVAVTDNPVVAGQGPFVFLANATDASDMDADDDGDMGSATPVPVDELGRWNRVLTLLGLGQLPDDITQENIGIVLDALLNTVDADENEDSDADPALTNPGDQTMPPLNPASGANMPAELSNKSQAGAAAAKPVTSPAATPAGAAIPAAPAPAADAANLSNVSDPATALTNLLTTLVNGQTEVLAKIGEQAEKIVNLSNTVATLQTEKADAKKAAYLDRLNALAAAGSLTAAEVERETKFGEAMQWDLSNLAFFDGRKAVDLSNRSKSLADGSAPAVAGVSPELSAEDIKAGVQWMLRGVQPPKAAAAA